MNASALIGIDLGGTFIKGGVVDPSGDVIERASIETQAGGGFEHVFSRIVAFIADLAGVAKGSNRDIAGIGIGVPGPLSHKRGFIFGAPNLPGWVDVPLRDKLQQAAGLPVVLENDANAAAFGEFTAGAGRDVEGMVLLTLGTGIGGGLVLDGRLQRGAHDNAGEVGHMIIVPGGRACPCGQNGCLERYSSANAIAERLIEAVQAGGRSSCWPKAGPAAELTSADVEDAMQKGDKLAAQIWDEACRYLALGCVNLQHVLNPQRIVLAGGLIKAGDALLQPVRRHFSASTWNVAPDQPDIALATLGNDAGMIGAAVLAHRELVTGGGHS